MVNVEKGWAAAAVGAHDVAPDSWGPIGLSVLHNMFLIHDPMRKTLNNRRCLVTLVTSHLEGWKHRHGKWSVHFLPV